MLCEYKTLEKFVDEATLDAKLDLLLIVHVNVVSLQKKLRCFEITFNRLNKTVHVICYSET